jgi:hypothetical protein
MKNVRKNIYFTSNKLLRKKCLYIGSIYVYRHLVEKRFDLKEVSSAAKTKARCVVDHSLYGLKSAGAAFGSSLAQILRDVGYDSTKAR